MTTGTHVVKQITPQYYLILLKYQLHYRKLDLRCSPIVNIQKFPASPTSTKTNRCEPSQMQSFLHAKAKQNYCVCVGILTFNKTLVGVCN